MYRNNQKHETTIVNNRALCSPVEACFAQLASIHPSPSEFNMEVKSYQLLKSDKTEIGLVAHEALKLFPEVVYNNVNDKGEQFYTMDYSRIGVVAIKAIAGTA